MKQLLTSILKGTYAETPRNPTVHHPRQTDFTVHEKYDINILLYIRIIFYKRRVTGALGDKRERSAFFLGSRNRSRNRVLYKLPHLAYTWYLDAIVYVLTGSSTMRSSSHIESACALFWPASYAINSPIIRVPTLPKVLNAGSFLDKIFPFV